jgi:hypothetical protein
VTTTWATDLTAAIVAIWQDQATATPDGVRKVYRSQPGSFGETPCAYIGDRAETVTHDAGTRTRLSTVTMVLVDTYRDNLQTSDLMDVTADYITDRFDVTTNVQRIGSSIINYDGYRDQDITFTRPDGTTVSYRGRLFSYSASKMEGRQ